MFHFIRKTFASLEHLRNKSISITDKCSREKTTVTTLFQKMFINCAPYVNTVWDTTEDPKMNKSILRNSEGTETKKSSKNTNCNIHITSGLAGST